MAKPEILSWKLIGWGFLVLITMFIALSSILLALLGVMSWSWGIGIPLALTSVIAFLFVLLPKVVEINQLRATFHDLQEQVGLVSPALRDELGVVQEKIDSLETRPNALGLWNILREQLKEAYLWDLDDYTPIDKRTYPQPEHQFFAAMLDRDHTGERRNVVEILNLRALNSKDEIAWLNTVRVTDFEEFEEMVEAGRFNRAKLERPTLSIDGLTAQVKA